MKPAYQLLCCVAAVAVVSCGSGSNKTSSSTTSGYQPLSERINQKNGYKQDASGNWVPQIDKRSSFETQGESPYFKGAYQKKTYQTQQYQKKSWWGDKDYGHKTYDGPTDGSRFQKTSALSGQGAPEGGQAADIPGPYQTNRYATGAAREMNRKGIDKPSDAETDIRRRVYQPPEIMDWRQQRALSVEQSKKILGN